MFPLATFLPLDKFSDGSFKAERGNRSPDNPLKDTEQTSEMLQENTRRDIGLAQIAYRTCRLWGKA